MQSLRYLGADNTACVAVSEDGKIWRDGGDERTANVADAASWPEIDPSGLQYLFPVAQLGRIFCIGLNYKAHAAEMNMKAGDHPVVFTRFESSFVLHGQPVIRPHLSEELDHEAELAVVIGTGGRHIKEADALSHIAGYTLANDGSVRDYQKRTSQFTMGKNFDSSGSLGPVLVSADSLPEGCKGLTMTGRLNGDVVQQTSTDDMIFEIATLISMLSEAIALQPGDVILTGTPSGVQMGYDTPRWLKPGDVFSVEIDGIGVLENPVAAEVYP